MYAIHTSPGFIIDSRPFGEAGKLLSIFTRDFGLVRAAAQGIRLEKSKLRYYAQDYFLGTFSLVRGKEFWRLTSAQAAQGTQEIRNMKYEVGHKSQELIARVASLLKRLLQGEEAHPELFECVQACMTFLSEMPNLTEEQLKTLESITVLRILKTLGYIGNDTSLNGEFESRQLSPEVLNSLVPKRTLMNKHINKALEESHL
jgi:DNA repair protein RecO